MNILNFIPTYKVLEINLSTGMRIGHVLAQAKYESTASVVENGSFFQASKLAKDELVLAGSTNGVGPMFLHYTEELIEIGNITMGLNHYALEPNSTDGAVNTFYPRGIAVYTGDTFTTNNYNLETGVDLEDATWAYIKNGTLEATNAYPDTTKAPAGIIFQTVAATLPDGTTEALEFTAVEVR